MNDQANRLREMAMNVRKEIEAELKGNFQKTRVIVISSGKGGVGKTTIAVNIAMAISSMGKKVVLMDADMGLANIDIMLGILPKYNLYHMIQGQKNIKDIIIPGPGDLMIIPGGSGIDELANIDQNQLQKLLTEIGKIDGQYDYMIIDTGAGISKHVIAFLLAADDAIIITTPEPTSLTDAYGIIKTVHRRQSFAGNLYLVVNRVSSDAEGTLVAEKFKQVCTKFLNRDIALLGSVVNEPLIGEGIKQQQPFIRIYPKNSASRNMKSIARSLMEGVAGWDDYNHVDKPAGGIKKFFKKISHLIQ
ncbi:MAG: MinD/ParA family protein [Syntrophomonadaceae bacterium]|nr:MinD/ParA family protein [Syntrophomonadaceae bacterium]MDD3888621.1 MinD/ParA family protein [Syntrophomonadaceae bacterium]MDD4548244.1 MinD/ParA family protein [Syntrophomonadaceae bacterium]